MIGTKDASWLLPNGTIIMRCRSPLDSKLTAGPIIGCPVGLLSETEQCVRASAANLILIKSPPADRNFRLAIKKRSGPGGG